MKWLEVLAMRRPHQLDAGWRAKAATTTLGDEEDDEDEWGGNALPPPWPPLRIRRQPAASQPGASAPPLPLGTQGSPPCPRLRGMASSVPPGADFPCLPAPAPHWATVAASSDDTGCTPKSEETRATRSGERRPEGPACLE